MDLGGTHALAGIHLYTGISPTTAVSGFKLQFRRDGQWVDIPSAVVTNNHAAALALPFDDTVAVTTDRLRLWITATPDGYARIKELVVWPASVGSLPPLAAEHYDFFIPQPRAGRPAVQAFRDALSSQVFRDALSNQTFRDALSNQAFRDQLSAAAFRQAQSNELMRNER